MFLIKVYAKMYDCHYYGNRYKAPICGYTITDDGTLEKRNVSFDPYFTNVDYAEADALIAAMQKLVSLRTDTAKHMLTIQCGSRTVRDKYSSGTMWYRSREFSELAGKFFAIKFADARHMAEIIRTCNDYHELMFGEHQLYRSVGWIVPSV